MYVRTFTLSPSNKFQLARKHFLPVFSSTLNNDATNMRKCSVMNKFFTQPNIYHRCQITVAVQACLFSFNDLQFKHKEIPNIVTYITLLYLEAS